MDGKVLTLSIRLRLPDLDIDVDQSAPLSGCTALFGPSGAGKTTLLRLIAGFTRPDAGRIAFDGDVWCDTGARRFTPAHQRGVGVMFQDARLFPHLSVAQNLQYAERRSEAAGRGLSVAEAVDAFGLEALLERRPASLSGGERQRCALARTLLSRPRLMLLDEPLASLDDARKQEILPYLQRLPERFGAPVIYVSHSVHEIAALAQTVLRFEGGRISASGSTADVLNAYLGDNVSHTASVVAGRVLAHDDAAMLTRIDLGGARLSAPINRRLPIGAEVNIWIDARDVAIALEPPRGLSIRNALPAVVETIAPRHASPMAEVSMRVNGAVLRAELTRAAVNELGVAPGQEVTALVKTARIAP